MRLIIRIVPVVQIPLHPWRAIHAAVMMAMTSAMGRTHILDFLIEAVNAPRAEAEVEGLF